MLLTIGMAHCNDFDGAYFTIQDIRKELVYNNRQDLMNEIEFLIVDNSPDKDNLHRTSLQNFSRDMKDVRITHHRDTQGTSASRNAVVENANGKYVLVMDCHVLLCPVVETLDKLITFIKENPDAKNLYSGPLVYDNFAGESTHFNDEWSSQMWGQWRTSWDCKCGDFKFSVEKNTNNTCEMRDTASQDIYYECPKCKSSIRDISYYGHESVLHKQSYVTSHDTKKPFEIFSQGLGLFFVKKDQWLGFNKHAVGFGGEEGYIHEKYRKNGRHAICLPFLKWMHRFHRPDGVKYPLTMHNKVRNYILEFTELEKPLDEIRRHFVDEHHFSMEEWDKLVVEAKDIYKTKETKVSVKSKPSFITCICPTYKRPKHMAAAVKCFEEQDYPKDRCELIILDDAGQVNSCTGENWKLVSTTDRVGNLWGKFNAIAELRNPETDIICVWEDDDIYLPWHISSIAKSRKSGEKQFFAPSFAYSNYGQTMGDVVKENCSGRFHATWAYSIELWKDVNGYESVLNINGDKVMREKCLRSAGEYTRYEGTNPSYIYRWARADWHTSVILDLKSEQEFQEKWDYLGFKPFEKVNDFKPVFDEEALVLYKKFVGK